MGQEDTRTTCAVEGCETEVHQTRYLHYDLCMLHYYLQETGKYGSE